VPSLSHVSPSMNISLLQIQLKRPASHLAVWQCDQACDAEPSYYTGANDSGNFSNGCGYIFKVSAFSASCSNS